MGVGNNDGSTDAAATKANKALANNVPISKEKGREL
jgi:hypothetical protein